jgi:ribonuclease HI
MNKIKDVTIFTDGACEPNPGPGGYGAILIFGEHRKELSGGFRLTTNNRMEIYAAIAGLNALKEPCRVKLYSDSKYLVEAMTLGWIQRWESKDWRRTKNPDLWKSLLELCKTHQVEFIWVKGHVGNPENERCDVLALEASRASNLPVDEIYESDRIAQQLHAEKTPITKPSVSHRSKSRTKIVYEGQPCRKCSRPVIKKIRNRKSLKPGQSYYYEYFFLCPSCKTMYMVEEAKKYVDNTQKSEGDNLKL